MDKGVIDTEQARAHPEGSAPSRNASPTSLDQLTRALNEGAHLQAQLNHIFAERLMELENLTRQGHETLANSFRELERVHGELKDRITSVAAATSLARPSAVPVGENLLLANIMNRFLMYVEASDMSVTPHLIFDRHYLPGMCTHSNQIRVHSKFSRGIFN
jgi:hypothetical protein